MTQGARLRLTAGYAAIWAAMLLVLCGVAYFAMSRSLDREVDAGIRSVVETWVAGAPPLAELRPVDVEREFEGGTADVFLLVFRVDGTLLANPNRVHVEDLLEHGALAGVLRRGGWDTMQAEEGHHLRLLAEPIVERGEVVGSVVGGRSLQEHDAQQRMLLVVLAVAGGAALLIAVWGGYVLAGRALQPLQLAHDRQRAFIADASHELRAPLTVVRTSADLLLRGDLPEEQRRSIEEIRDVTEEAALLVEDLLALARLERTDAVRAAETSRLDEAAREVMEQLRPLLDAHGCHLDVDLDPVAARLGAVEVRRVVRALLENVLRYTPPGTAVEIRTLREHGRALLVVADTGPGVPEADLGRIFERFSQIEGARTPGAQRGAGLGLAIVRALVEAVGGSVRARNRAEGGLEVEVELPAAT